MYQKDTFIYLIGYHKRQGYQDASTSSRERETSINALYLVPRSRDIVQNVHHKNQRLCVQIPSSHRSITEIIPLSRPPSSMSRTPRDRIWGHLDLISLFVESRQHVTPSVHVLDYLRVYMKVHIFRAVFFFPSG